MRDKRSVIWGGATLGLCIGVIGGIFDGPFWTWVLDWVLIGVGLGAVAGLLGWASDRLRTRGEPKQEWVVSEAELNAYMNQLMATGLDREGAYDLTRLYGHHGLRLTDIKPDAIELIAYFRELRSAGVDDEGSEVLANQFAKTGVKPE
jgi:hypothetical protein